MKRYSKWIIAVLLLLLFVIDYNVPPPFFGSNAFEMYYQNWLGFLKENNDELYQEVSYFKPNSKSNNRSFFQKNLEHIRSQGNLDHARWIYTSNNLWDSIAAPGDNTIYTLSKSIKRFEKELDKSQKKGGWFKAGDHSKDLHHFGNVPFPLFQMSTGALVIRTPVPLIDDVTVSPEFYSFLRSVKARNEKHLYVNLMKMRKEEKPQTETIHLLESDPEIGSSITVITLDASSDFFWQETVEFNAAEAFKNAFLAKMRTPNQGYRWSNRLDLDLDKIVNEVHQVYFQSKDVLSEDERINFIHITTLALIYEAFEMEKFQTINVSCQHTLDRGGAFLALLYYCETAQEDGSIKSKDFNRFSSLITEIPPLMHNRATHKNRAAQIPSVLKTLY